MSVRTKAARKAIWIANGAVNLFVLTLILLLLTFSCYAIWDSNQIYSAASSSNYELYKPTAENEGLSFAELQALNQDVFAWLTVYGTNIDYPVVQGENNIRYINTDARGRHSLSGAIFLDYRSGPNFSDFSSILYGHHMQNQVMFGEIELFSERSYFDTHRYGRLYVDGKERGLEFFAFLHADAYDLGVFRVNITEREEQQAYLDLLMEMAVHSRQDASVGVDAQIVLLSTCSPGGGNGRDILAAKITDTVHRDPFETEETESPRAIPVIDELARAPSWMKISLAAMTFLLIVLVLILTYTKGKGR